MMDLFLRYVPIPLLAILLALMVRNRAYRFCPVFFTYVAFGVCADVSRFVVHNHLRAYFWVYWSTEAGYCLLGVAALYEVLHSVRHVYMWWARLVFVGVMALAITLSLAHAHSVPSQIDGRFMYIVTGEIAVRFAQTIVFLIVGALAVFRRLRWHPLGVAAGFGFYSSIELLNMIAVWSHGTKSLFLWVYASIASYSLAVLIWIWFFRVPFEEEPTPDLKMAAHFISRLAHYGNRIRRIRKIKILALLHLTGSHPEHS